MDPALLVFAWFWVGQQPATSQIQFSSMAQCQEARQALTGDRKRALEETGDSRRVPQLTATCLATGPAKPATAAQPAVAHVAVPAGGIDWLASQPVNLLDWGLQRAANSIETVRSVRVVYEVNGAAAEDVVDVDFSLAESGRQKYLIQGMVLAKTPELVSEAYCVSALRAWRQAVLKINGDKPSASIDVWFSHADRGGAERPKALAETVAAGFEFKMTINGAGNGAGQQAPVSCLTPFALDPVAVAAPALPAKVAPGQK